MPGGPGIGRAISHRKGKTRIPPFSILIHVGPASLGTLKEFADRLSTIKQLTGDEAKEIFVKF
jgi:hypothetical protein